MKKKSTYLFIFLCIICFLGLQLLVELISKSNQNIIPRVPNTSMCGVITMLEVLVGVAMTIVDWQVGGKAAIIMVASSCLWNIISIMLWGNYYSLPGVFSLGVSCLMFYMIRQQFKKRHIEDYQDYLTKIPNRRYFINELKNRIAQGSPFYLVYMDINNFKRVNDEFGHISGDLVLTETVKYWQEKLRNEDFLARIAGDEFCMIIPKKNVTNFESFIVPLVLDIAYKKIDGYDGNKYPLLASSAGIVSYPEDGLDDAQLLRKADIAMYKAKKEKQKTYCFYDEEIERQIVYVSKIEEQVRKGFEEDRFFLMYQPQFDVSTKQLRGFEALIRLKGDNDEVIGPKCFIPMMEKIGSITKVDFFVLNKAMQDFSEVVKQYPDIRVSVNISATHITDPEFIDDVRSTLRANEFPAKNLEIEITEYSLIHSLDEAIININRLRELGVSIALDDFGTGYSSLAILAKLPFDLIKIDKGLIDNIHTDAESKELVSHIISIGQSLNCEILSEGIENEEQADILREQGCNYIQGYLWGKPHSQIESLKEAI